jgi:hypothetical protein
MFKDLQADLESPWKDVSQAPGKQGLTRIHPVSWDLSRCKMYIYMIIYAPQYLCKNGRRPT